MSTGFELSPRLQAIFDALPITPGMRVIEIGCGPGALARAMTAAGAFVLAVDRSANAVAQVTAGCAAEIADGRLIVRQAEAETFALAPGEAPYDLAIAVRVGVLDGRHPRNAAAAIAALYAALTPEGRLFIDGGDPLRVVPRPERQALPEPVPAP